MALPIARLALDGSGDLSLSAMSQTQLLFVFLMQDVALALASVSLPCKLEVEYVATDYTIDMALPSMRLAIEADGPLHFMRNVARPAGRTLGQHNICPSLLISLWFVY